MRNIAVWVLALLPFLAQSQVKSGQTLDKIILKADNHILLRSEWEVGVLQAVNGGAKETDEMRCNLLRQLALAKLMLAKAEIDSVIVKDEEVDQELDQRMSYMTAAVGGRDKLVEMYHKTADQLKIELRPQVRDQLTVRKMQGKITGDVKVTPAQVRRYFNSIAKDSLPLLSTEVEVGQIVRLAKPGKARKLAARTKAEQLRSRILNGEDFDIMARLYSQDPGSAAQGGKLPGAERGQMVPEYEAAAMSLKAGETSPVTESQFGFHIIQLLDKRGNEYDSRHILIRPETDTEDKLEAYRYLDSLRLAIARDSIKFDKAAVKFSDDVQTKSSGGFIVDGNTGASRVSTENLDPKIFFTLDTMDVGQVSRPVPFTTEDNKEGWRILYYKGKSAPHQANLKDDYQRIQTAAMAQRKQKAMEDWVGKAKGEVSIWTAPEIEICRPLDIVQLVDKE